VSDIRPGPSRAFRLRKCARRNEYPVSRSIKLRISDNAPRIAVVHAAPFNACFIPELPMIRPIVLATVVAAVLGGCTWVKMEPQGTAVRVAREAEDLGFCLRRGEVTVSVRDRVGLYERNDLKVRDELEVLARNEAPRLQADTVQPLGEPWEGEQRFVAYSCRGGAVGTAAPARVAQPPQGLREDEQVETFPIRDD
jgi:hypothetical protein